MNKFIEWYLIFIFGIMVGYGWCYYHDYKAVTAAQAAYKTLLMQYVPYDTTNTKSPKIGLKPKTFG